MKRLLSLPFVVLALMPLLGGTAFAERMAVSVSVGNVRSGPGDSYDVLWQVERNYPIETLRSEGDWIFFKDFEGDEGWIHRSLVGKARTVITRRDRSNIRSGPGTRFDVLFTVDKGVPFKALKSENDWIQVVHADGDQGWIHRGLVW